jgi:hypothetical protein
VLAACTSAAALDPPAVVDSEPPLDIPSTPPLPGTPLAGQAAIDEALAHFAITVPPGVRAPRYAPDLGDRGRTSWKLFGGDPTVAIGPAAFASWGLLGSTLAHELEIHCRQNLFSIAAGDVLGLPTKLTAEREAYGYELRGAGRFGLTRPEIRQIAATLSQLDAGG